MNRQQQIPAEVRIKDEFPRVYNRIEELWGSRNCREYLASLGVQEKDQSRDGFPFHIFVELNELIALHDKMYPVLDVEEAPFMSLEGYEGSNCSILSEGVFC